MGSKKSFACGAGRCQVGSESCCGKGDDATCVENAPPDPPGTSQLWASQIERCEAAPGKYALDEIARCRSSEHCPGQELCCNEFLYGGASAILCKPPEGGEPACNYGEMCTPDLPCRSPGTSCVKGICRKSTQVSCGGKMCDLTTHTCVHTDPDVPTAPSCEAEDQIEAWRAEGRPIFSIGCLRHADCQSGELCREALGSSSCLRADDGMSGVMCEDSRDCPTDMCLPPKTTVVCNTKASWHGLCDCL
jgi:hypothetical protein